MRVAQAVRIEHIDWVNAMMGVLASHQVSRQVSPLILS